MESDIRNTNVHIANSLSSIQRQKSMMELYEKLHNIGVMNEAEHGKILFTLSEALEQIAEVESFSSQPGKILGSSSSKHGEIAEHINVSFRNAERIMHGKTPNSTFERVGRTAPVDYISNGVSVQAKYYKSTDASLDAVIAHLKKYESIGFGRDSSYYEIPKDQYEEIMRILSGDSQGIDKASSILKKIEEIEKLTGKDIKTAVRSGKTDANSVKLDQVESTIEKEKNKLVDIADEQRDKADKKADTQRAKAQDEAKPTFKKAAQVGLQAAAVSGDMQLAFGIFSKCRNGKKIEDFTAEDWKEIGLNTGKASIQGGISGVSLYGISNLLTSKLGVSNAVAEPVGSAAISLVFGLVELTYDYNIGRISKEKFHEACSVTVINAVICAVGAHIGSTLIPIPVLGSVIGSFIAGKGVTILLDDGVQNALMNSSEYIYGMTSGLQQLISQVDSNISHIHQSNCFTYRAQNEISQNQAAFDDMKR